MKISLRFTILMLLVIFSTTLASADSTSSETYTGSMDQDTEEFTVNVSLAEGQFLIAEAIATSDDLDPYLILKDSNGNTLIENDDVNPDSIDSLLGFYIDTTGEYELVLANVYETSGDYLLNVTIVDSGELIDEFETDIESLDGKDEGAYEIDLEAGQTIIFQTEVFAGDLDTVLFLLDSEGDVIGWNDDRYTDELNSYLVFTAPETDTYEIVVIAWGDTSGDYQLYAQIFDTDFADNALPTAGQTEKGREIPTTKPDDVVEGTIEGEYNTAVYTVELAAGEGLIVLGESQRGVLDIIVRIYDEDDNVLSDSDDWSETWHSVTAYFIAPEDDVYYVELTAENDTQGDYTLTFKYAEGDTIMNIMRVELSGLRQTVETENFIIHYTREGFDAISDEQAYFIADIMENVYDRQINELGWYAPLNDGWRGGDARYDVYIQNILESDGNYGYAVPEYPIRDNPNSEYVEEFAMGGYLIVAGTFSDTSPEEIERLLISTLGHEFHHLIQFGYNATGENWWYYEATSTYMEVATLPPYNDAVGYTENVFYYPEICLGAMDDADPTGLLMYGSWLFIQSLIDTYGDQILNEYWENLAKGHGWEALEVTLAKYDTVVQDVAIRYHVLNLLLDYELAPAFADLDYDRVWVDDLIGDTGNWEMGGEGVQELAVNYYLVDLADGVYQFTLRDAHYKLKLYAVGIDTESGTADVFSLDNSGAVDVSGYDEFVLMVFNNNYHDELDSCNYRSYSIDVVSGGDALPVLYEGNASNYRSLYE